MAENPLGDFFISDLDDDTILDPTPGVTPQITVPTESASVRAESAATTAAPVETAPAPAATAPPAVSPESAATDSATEPPVAEAGAVEAVPEAPLAPATVGRSTRELQLAAALDRLMLDSPQIEAAALVSLDGFTMAAALPEGMHEDRVGAMSAAILGLGERAAAELGKGKLSQVFIEGDDGYVVLMAAGSGAVLTCLAGTQAKLGLLLYDMRAAAASITDLLG